MKSVADKVREADSISNTSFGKITVYDITSELRILYINNDVEGLRDLYGAFCEMESRMSGDLEDDVAKNVLNYMDWFSQAADAMLKSGNFELELHHLGHSRNITGPVCDFFRQKTGYEPDF